MVILENIPKTKLIQEGVVSAEISEYCVLPSPLYRRSNAECRSCAFSSDERLFAWSFGNRFVQVIRLPKKEREQTLLTINDDTGEQQAENLLHHIDCADIIQAMEFSPSGFDKNENIEYLLATGLDNGRVKIWNPVTGDMVYNLSDHYNRINGISFSKNGEPLLISCSIDKTLKVWDLADDGNMTLTITGHPLPILDCAFSPADSTLICSVGQGRSAIIWNLPHKRSFSLRRQLKGHHNDVVSCSWSPDGALVATASRDTTVIIWDPFSGQQILILGHANPLPEPIYAGGANGAWLISACFSPDGSRIATVCEDDKLRIWSLWSDKDNVAKSLVKPGFRCCFSPSGSKVAVGISNGSAVILDAGVEVMSLSYLSRLAIRKKLQTNDIDALNLPSAIDKYLHYRLSAF